MNSITIFLTIVSLVLLMTVFLLLAILSEGMKAFRRGDFCDIACPYKVTPSETGSDDQVE